MAVWLFNGQAPRHGERDDGEVEDVPPLPRLQKKPTAGDSFWLVLRLDSSVSRLDFSCGQLCTIQGGHSKTCVSVCAHFVWEDCLETPRVAWNAEFTYLFGPCHPDAKKALTSALFQGGTQVRAVSSVLRAEPLFGAEVSADTKGDQFQQNLRREASFGQVWQASVLTLWWVRLKIQELGLRRC